jgi:ubiquinone/menaquinone biosynthesis C-methylase UbiE
VSGDGESRLGPRVTEYFARNDAAIQWWGIDTETGGRYAKQLAFVSQQLAVRDKRVIDIATGPGRFAIAMAIAGAADVTAVDLSTAMVELAKTNARRAGVERRIRFVVGDAAELDFEPESFGVVTLMEVLVHLPDPARAISVASGLLEPTGFLLTNYHNPHASTVTYPVDKIRGFVSAMRGRLRGNRSPATAVMYDTLDETIAALDRGGSSQLINRPRDAYRGLADQSVTGWLRDARLEIVAHMSEHVSLYGIPIPVPIGRTVLCRKLPA